MKKRTAGLFLTAVLGLAALAAGGCGNSAADGQASSVTDSQTSAEGSAEDTSSESVSAGGEASGSGADSQEVSGSDADSQEASGGAAEETQYPLTITDDLGNTVTIEEEPERVVSLSPSNTETLFALGADERIVGRTDYCSYPEEAAEVPSIGTYTSPNTELIISMTPDVIFASDYIDDSIRSQVEGAGAKVIVFAASDLEGVEQNILTAGQVLNLNGEAKEITDGMEAEMAQLQEILSANTEEKSAFIDLGGYYSAGEGSLLGNMLEDIGVRNVAADTGEMWPQLSVEKIIESDPDVYISLYTTPEELKQVSGLSELDCIKNDRIVYYDGLSPEADMIQRAGPRLAEGTRLLAEQIYPELFS